MTVEVQNRAPEADEPLVVNGELRCALTGKALRPDEAYWAPPLITTGQLVSTLFTTVTRTPADLGRVLFAEQPNVPYAPEAREELGARRTTEQLKFLGVLLLVAVVLLSPVLLMAL